MWPSWCSGIRPNLSCSGRAEVPLARPCVRHLRRRRATLAFAAAAAAPLDAAEMSWEAPAGRSQVGHAPAGGQRPAKVGHDPSAAGETGPPGDGNNTDSARNGKVIPAAEICRLIRFHELNLQSFEGWV